MTVLRLRGRPRGRRSSTGPARRRRSPTCSSSATTPPPPWPARSSRGELEPQVPARPVAQHARRARRQGPGVDAERGGRDVPAGGPQVPGGRVSMSVGGADGSLSITRQHRRRVGGGRGAPRLRRRAPARVALRVEPLHPDPAAVLDRDGRSGGRSPARSPARSSRSGLPDVPGDRRLPRPPSSAASQRAVVRVTVELDGAELGVLPFTGGSVDCDGTRDGALRSLSLTVSPDPDAFDWLATAGAEIVVARGLVLDDGTEELVPLGVFVLDADLEETEDGTITVSAGDRSRRISRARWTDPYTVPAGTARRRRDRRPAARLLAGLPDRHQPRDGRQAHGREARVPRRRRLGSVEGRAGPGGVGRPRPVLRRRRHGAGARHAGSGERPGVLDLRGRRRGRGARARSARPC